MILPRRAIEKIGMFDESLFTGEDRNFCDRVRSAGGRIFFSSDVVVYHQSRTLWKPFMRQRFTYGHGSLGIVLKNTGIGNLMLFLPVAWLVIFMILTCFDLMHEDNMPFSPLLAAACLLAACAEAIRHSSLTHEIPHTFAALILSYFATTIGQIAVLCRLPLNMKQIYSGRQQYPARNRYPELHSKGNNP